MIDLDIDLFIIVRFDGKEHIGESTLAKVLVEYLEPDNGKPLLGLVNINSEVDYSKEKFFAIFSRNNHIRIYSFFRIFKSLFH